MPSTVSTLLDRVPGLQGGAVVPWLRPIQSDGPGVYIVSLSADPHRNAGTHPTAPIDEASVATWIRRVQKLTLDGRRPSAGDLVRRLSEFWLADESILYIGKATKLGSRVGDFYKTPLGDPGPHSGGHWIKTLSVLPDAFVHFAETADPIAAKRAEHVLVDVFLSQISSTTRERVTDCTRCFPFGNLEHPPGTRRQHGILNSRLR